MGRLGVWCAWPGDYKFEAPLLINIDLIVVDEVTEAESVLIAGGLSLSGIQNRVLGEILGSNSRQELSPPMNNTRLESD